MSALRRWALRKLRGDLTPMEVLQAIRRPGETLDLSVRPFTFAPRVIPYARHLRRLR